MLAKKYNVKFLFKLHCEMEKYESLFKKFTNVELVPNADLFEPLFIKSSLIITDYTSNVYEMGMVNKPCIYFEPDWKELTANLLKKDGSVFDINTQGIGPVADTPDKLFTILEKTLQADYKVDAKYTTRRKTQISFINDPNCCKRAYEAIIKLPAKKKAVIQAKKQEEKKKTIGQQPNTYLYF